MKLRNKKTGKIRDFEFVAISKENDELIAKTVSLYTHHAPVLICRSIDQLNEEWEDYDEKAEEEAIAMLKQLSEAIDRMNANMAKICGNFTIFGKGKK